MPYDDRGQRGGLIVAIGMIVLIVSVVALLVGVIWLFVADANSDGQPDRDVFTVETPQVTNNTTVLSDSIDILLERDGIDTEVGDICSDGEDPSVAVAVDLNRRLQSDKVAVPIAYDYVQFLPAPCIVWIAEENMAKPVVLISADEASVYIVDPEMGDYQYGFSQFSEMYDAAGRHALCVVDRGYSTEGKYGVLQERGL